MPKMTIDEWLSQQDKISKKPQKKKTVTSIDEWLEKQGEKESIAQLQAGLESESWRERVPAPSREAVMRHQIGTQTPITPQPQEQQESSVLDRALTALSLLGPGFALATTQQAKKKQQQAAKTTQPTQPTGPPPSTGEVLKTTLASGGKKSLLTLTDFGKLMTDVATGQIAAHPTVDELLSIPREKWDPELRARIEPLLPKQKEAQALGKVYALPIPVETKKRIQSELDKWWDEKAALAEQAKTTRQGLKEWIAEDERRMAGATPVQKTIYQVGSELPTQLAQIVATGLSGGSMVPLGLSATASTMAELEEQGVPYKERLARSVASGLIEAGTERISVPEWIKYFKLRGLSEKELIEKGLQEMAKLGSKTLGQWAKYAIGQWLKSATGEIGEELVADPLHNLADILILDEQKPVWTIEQAGETALQSGVMSLILGALGLPSQYKSYQMAKQMLQQNKTPTAEQAERLHEQIKADTAEIGATKEAVPSPTGEVPAPTVEPTTTAEQAGATRPKVAASEKIPTPEETPLPETTATLSTQMEWLQEGKRKAVLITPGETMLEVPEGIKKFKTAKGTFLYRPDLIKPKEITQAITEDRIGDVLEYGISRKPPLEKIIGVVTIRGKDDIEKLAVVTDQEHLDQVMARARELAGPEDTVALEEPVEVVRKRITSTPVAPAVKKEPWEMTKAEWENQAKQLSTQYQQILAQETKETDPNSPTFRQAEQRALTKLRKITGRQDIDFGMLDGMGHKAFVREALASGKPVPPEVLKDYPDLKPVQKADTIKVSEKPASPLRFTVGEKTAKGYPLYEDGQLIGFKATQAEARATADRENARWAEYERADAEARKGFPVLEWGKNKPGYLKMIRGHAGYAEFLRQAKEVAWIAQPYEKKEPVYFYGGKLVRLGAHAPYSNDRPLHQVSPEEISGWRQRKDVAPIAERFGAVVSTKRITTIADAGAMPGLLKPGRETKIVIEQPKTAYAKEAALRKSPVYTDIRSKLMEVKPSNVSEKDWGKYIDHSALLWAAHAATESSRRGISVEEWYQGVNRPEIRNILDQPVEEPSGRTLYQYAGERAQTMDPLRLTHAKALKAAGMSNERIRLETGWFQGMDGKWRFIIIDSDAKMAGMGAKQLEASSKKFGEIYNDLKTKVAPRPYVRLADLLEHESLYKAYPWLQSIHVESQDEKGAAYSTADGTIHINKDMKVDKAISSLMHEIQHAIQEYEGFARGGSLAMAKELQDRGLLSAEDLKKKPEEIYFRQAGEIEARDTAKMWKYNKMWRDLIPPETRPDAIVVFRGKAHPYLVGAVQEVPAAAQTETPEFKRWFGKSKVVDKQGRPRIMYHGTDQERAIFDGGIFFTDSPRDASAYAEMKALEKAVEDNPELEEIVYDVLAKEGGKTITDLGPKIIREIAEANNIKLPSVEGYVMAVYVRAENPLDLREFGSDVGDVKKLWNRLHKMGLLDEAWDDLDEVARQEIEDDYENKALYVFLENEDIQAKAFKKGYDAITFIDIAPDGTGTHESWLVKSNTQFKSATGNIGTFDPNDPNIYRQSGDRARVTLSQVSSVISLMKKADESSFVHESAHIWLEDMFDYVRSGRADATYMDYWKTVADWLGVKKGQTKLTTEQHEKFARGFEAYMHEGKAPSTALQRVFEAFKQWLSRIYRTAVELNADINDSIRSFFDRMLATEAEIAEAKGKPIPKAVPVSSKRVVSGTRIRLKNGVEHIVREVLPNGNIVLDDGTTLGPAEVSGWTVVEAKAEWREAGGEAPRIIEQATEKIAATEILKPSAKRAASKAKEAAKEAYEGLRDLFGGEKMGIIHPAFNEETYRKARLHFDKAWQAFKDAGGEFADWVAHMIEEFGEGIREYLERYVSQFRLNTLARAVILQSDEIQKALKPEEFDYIPEHTEDWRNQAIENVKNDINEVMERINKREMLTSGTEALEGLIVSTVLVEKAHQSKDTADYHDLLKWTKAIAVKTRPAARVLRATAEWDKISTPAGAVAKAQRVIDKAEQEIEKSNPKITQQVKEETKKIKEELKKGDKEAIDEITQSEEFKQKETKAKNKRKKKNHAELLADRIISYVKPKTQREKDLIKQMLNELFGIAKESPLPKPERPRVNPIERIKDAIKNKEMYAETWEKAKRIVKEHFTKEESEINDLILEQLDAYFAKGVRPPFTKQILTKVIRANMKEMDMNLSELVRRYYYELDKAKETLAEHIIRQAGLSEEDANELSQYVQERFDELAKEKKRQILDRMLAEKSPQKRKTLTERVIELVNLGAYDDESIANLVKERLGLPVLTTQDAEFIVNIAKVAEAFPKNSREYRAAMSRIEFVVTNKIPPTIREKLRGIIRISLLPTPKTHVRNIGGNVILLGLTQTTENTIGPMVDFIVSTARGSERTTLFMPKAKLKALARGAKRGALEAIADIREGIDTSPTRTPWEYARNKILFKNPVLNTIDKFIRQGLSTADRVFYTAAYESRIEELKRIKKTDTPTEDMELEAHLYALDKVFQNNSVLAQKASELRRVLGIFGDILIPFTQTPANVLDKLFDYSPAGLARAIYSGIGSARKGVFDQKLFVDRVSRALTGSGIVLLGYILAKKGLITGRPPEDKDAREFLQAIGIQNYAFKIGKNQYTYDWMQPVGGLLAMGADLYYGGKDKKTVIDKLFGGAQTAIDTIFRQSFLSGVFRLMSGYSPAAGIAQSIAEAPLMFLPVLPTLSKQVAQLVDPYARQTKGKGLIDTTTKKLMARTPFASKLLPKQVDVLGREAKTYQGRANIFTVMLSPGFYTKEENQPAIRLVMDIYNRTGETKHFPRLAPAKLTIGNKTIPLEPEEQNELQKLMGQTTLKIYNQLTQNRAFLSFTDEVKIKFLQKLLDQIYDRARTKLLLTHPEILKREPIK